MRARHGRLLVSSSLLLSSRATGRPFLWDGLSSSRAVSYPPSLLSLILPAPEGSSYRLVKQRQKLALSKVPHTRAGAQVDRPICERGFADTTGRYQTVCGSPENNLAAFFFSPSCLSRSFLYGCLSSCTPACLGYGGTPIYISTYGVVITAFHIESFWRDLWWCGLCVFYSSRPLRKIVSCLFFC